MSRTKDGRGVSLVAIGGGTGLSTLLYGLKRLAGQRSDSGVWIRDLSAIVAVSDDGGSSGRLREELQMLPPGDIRNCMIALSEDSNLLSRLFRYRFRGEGDLGGHSFGNLFLAALTEVTGDFSEAVRLSSEVLASKGHIFPATISDVRLAAELENGERVRGETQITAARVPIKRLWLEPEKCLPLPSAVSAIRRADVITIGPGSLYTSLLPPLLVERVAEEISESPATKIFICNLMTQPGETDGFSAAGHLEAITAYAPQVSFDYVVLNDRPIDSEHAERYAAEGASQIEINEEALLPVKNTGAAVVLADLLDDGEKVRHSPEKLAAIIAACCGESAAEPVAFAR